MTEQLMNDLESCLALIHASGEWTGDHDAMLKRWREARGDAAKDGWRWWAKEADDELYQNDLGSRDEALVWALREYGAGAEIEIIEARTWSDEIQGDESQWFAETRNHEKLRTGLRAA